MDKKELVQFIKDNLVIEIECENAYCSGWNQRVSLRFIDEKESFTSAIVVIPDNE